MLTTIFIFINSGLNSNHSLKSVKSEAKIKCFAKVLFNYDICFLSVLAQHCSNFSHTYSKTFLKIFYELSIQLTCDAF